MVWPCLVVTMAYKQTKGYLDTAGQYLLLYNVYTTADQLLLVNQ